MVIFVWVIAVFLVVTWLGVVLIGPPFVPTLKRDLNKLFAELKLTKENHFVDFGAGDGRVLAMAARNGARVSGVEINPFLVLIAWFRLRRYKGSVTIGNMWQYRLPEDTTHVFVFGAGVFMNKLEHYFEKEAERRHFVVMCYGFKLPERHIERTVGAFNLYQF